MTLDRTTRPAPAEPARQSEPETPRWPAWLNPAVLVLVAMSLPAVAVALTPDQLFLEITGLYPASDGFLLQLAIVCGGGLVGLAVSTFIAPRARFRLVAETARFRHRARVLTTITTVAYLIYGALAVARGLGPALAASVLRGEPGALQASREAFAPVAGVTTLVAFGGPAVCALIVASAERKLTRPELTAIAVIVVGAFARGYLNAERLAILEVAIPTFFAIVARRRIRLAAEGVRTRSAPAMIAAAVAAVSLFATGELLRPSYQVREGTVNFGSYIYGRLSAYYLSSTANGEYLRHLIDAVPTPMFTAQAFWTFPGVSAVLTPSAVFGYDPQETFYVMLSQRLNPEMNTVGLAPSLLAEWGLVAATVIAAALTLVLSLSWRSGLNRLSAGGVAVLGVLIVASIESARYPYFLQGRFVVAFFGAWWIYSSARRSSSGKARS
uniref:hypothetical protein n=1 Tax=Paractinoplanes polyasparticus TaxID=2856853 RepID=UPI001C863664|nr:hypothetical protein [Actinoplanes polyasparticus]